MEIILLLVAVAITLYTAFSGKAEYAQFEKGKLSRSQLFQRWIGESWLLFGAFAVVALLLTHPDYLLHPIAHRSLFDATDRNTDHMQSIIYGVVIGTAVAVSIVFWRARRSIARGTKQAPSPLTPQNKEERWLAATMAITAGVCEELFFRAAIPGLVYLVTNNVALAFGVSIVLFGIEHIYQGWKGVLGTMVVGWLFVKLFTISGTLFVPIAVHAGMDLYGMILYPLLVDRTTKHLKT